MIYTNSEQEETCYVDGKFLDSLKKQLKGYNRVDPPTKHQEYLPKCVYQNLENIAKSKRDKLTANLLEGVF